MRWIPFCLSLALAALGLLTVFKAPPWVDWRLALLAGEFGHWISLMALGILILACSRSGGSARGIATAVLAGAAFVLLLKPSYQAWRLGRSLSSELGAAFGPGKSSRPPFSLAAHFSPQPAAVPFETIRYAGELDLDFYRAIGRTPAPCVIVIHGGGWDNGDRRELQPFNRWLACRGYAVAAISYRLAPRSIWPAQREDVAAAVEFLRARSASFGIDPARIVLFGRSAGGQIAEASAYGLPGLGVRGVIALYAPADLNFAYAFGKEDDVLKSPFLIRQFLGGTPSEVSAAYDSASAIGQVGPASPPTLLMHGELDPLVWHRQSERLNDRLGQAGVAHAFVSLPWATHAFEFNVNSPGGQLTTYAVEWFLAAETK